MQRETRIANIVLGALSALALLLLSLPLSTPVRSFKAGAGYLLDPLAYHGEAGYRRLSGLPERIRQLLQADIENEGLRAELRRGEWLATTVSSLSLENDRLRRALVLKAPAVRSPAWVRVMERDPIHWYRSVVVDAGADRGISLNDPVLGPREGKLVAVGRVVDVRPNMSTVLLLTDELSAAAAYLSSGTLEGLVQGQDGPRLRMNYLNAEARLSEGDSVYTSPTSATFPSDVLIGRVARVNPRDPFLTFQSVEVTPAADASSLQELMILRVKPLDGEAKPPVYVPPPALAPVAAPAAPAAETAAVGVSTAAPRPRRRPAPDAPKPAASEAAGQSFEAVDPEEPQ
ncbi:MAG: rod shape-determining protein MreC [Elusimicrobiota bacterium]|nr:rod shape-determining protein MreC [Elusimicrobiota bacterium]